jgi:putative solute:sodium symporter small subunit
MPLADSSQDIRSATSAAVDRATGEAYWRKTSGLMWTMLAIWAFFSFGIHIFAPSLNPIHILGFPLGFYMAAQGSLIVFVVSLFWFAKRQNQIDEEFGVQED